MKKIIYLILFLLILNNLSFAEISIANSLEWLTCSSEVIVIGKIKEISITKGVHSVIYEDCIVKIDEILKGDCKGKTLTFCLRTLSTEPTAKAFMNSEKGILLFFVQV